MSAIELNCSFFFITTCTLESLTPVDIFYKIWYILRSSALLSRRLFFRCSCCVLLWLLCLNVLILFKIHYNININNILFILYLIIIIYIYLKHTIYINLYIYSFLKNSYLYSFIPSTHSYL